jgi:hypothetical protein
MTESEDDAIELVEALREDIGEIEQGVVARHDRACGPSASSILEGLSPLTASGRWVPEQVRRAGGWDVLGREGEPASPTTWEAIKDVDPEMLLLRAGRTDASSKPRRLAQDLERPEFWSDLEAVRRGPGLLRGAGLLLPPGPPSRGRSGMLAEIFDPEGFIDTSPPNSWTPRGLGRTGRLRVEMTGPGPRTRPSPGDARPQFPLNDIEPVTATWPPGAQDGIRAPSRHDPQRPGDRVSTQRSLVQVASCSYGWIVEGPGTTVCFRGAPLSRRPTRRMA